MQTAQLMGMGRLSPFFRLFVKPQCELFVLISIAEKDVVWSEIMQMLDLPQSNLSASAS